VISVLWVALGGSLGAVARYGGNVLTRALLPDHSWPIATFSINLLGACCIGALYVLLERQLINEAARHFLLIGLLGGFTTFSTFSLELMHMTGRGAWGQALGYAVLSVLCCALGAVGGAQLVRSLT